MILTYIAGEDIHYSEFVSIREDGTICRHVEGATLPAFAMATRSIRTGETITFSQDEDTDLRSRLTVEVWQG